MGFSLSRSSLRCYYHSLRVVQQDLFSHFYEFLKCIGKNNLTVGQGNETQVGNNSGEFN